MNNNIFMFYTAFTETLRKYSIATTLTREAATDYTFENTKITIPKKTRVLIPVYAIQQDPDFYPDPKVFDPERFDEENVKKRNPMSYLPFGDGSRNCIGIKLIIIFLYLIGSFVKSLIISE